MVIGAEEFDPIILDAYAKVRWLRRDGRFVPAEGAGALLLRRVQPDDKARVLAIREGFTYRNKAEARRAASELVGAAFLPRHPGGRDKNVAPTVWRSAEHNWLAGIEDELHRRHCFDTPSALPYVGEAFTASAAWHTIRALSTGGRFLQPVWGLNEQCSALLLETG